MSTLLEKVARATYEAFVADVADMEPVWEALPESHQDRMTAATREGLKAVLTPTHAMVNRGGVKAFAGPQPEGGPPMIYPALIWREMLSYVIEEGDRERPDETGPEGEGEGGREPEVLQEHSDARGDEPGAEPEAGDRAL